VAETGYLAPAGFVDDLKHELGSAVRATHGRLVIAEGAPRPVAWAANIWHAPQSLAIASIGDAAKQLRAMQRNWALYPTAHHRRATLITEKLPKVSAKPLRFGDPAPSRAYLKLWELFTLTGARPKADDICVDLGASPGGWTWVLASLGARVTAVDKAALAPAVTRLPNVTVLQQSAFALEPHAVGPIDWLFSDVICYPARLLALVEKWMKAGTVRRFVCTVKFQGATDFETARHFAQIPGSRLLHLHHNKHELTWLKLS